MISILQRISTVSRGESLGSTLQVSYSFSCAYKKKVMRSESLGESFVRVCHHSTLLKKGDAFICLNVKDSPAIAA